MIVVYNADERFAEVFATSLVSLYENNRDIDELKVYLIEDHISAESKTKLLHLAEGYGRELVMLVMPDLNELAGVNVEIPQYNRMATCGRLFIASLLPQKVEKAIYLDCDTIILKSIKELWDIDISDYAVGMADCCQNSNLRTQLGLEKDGTYYNSGVMLVNLKRWRQMEAERKFLAFIQSQGGYIPFPDEGVLNAVFNGQILRIPLRFNALTMIYAFTYKQFCYAKGVKNFYTAEEVEAARRDPVLIHFVSNFYLPVRPWMQGCEHPYADRYLEYRKLTPWNSQKLWEDTRPMLNKVYTIFCHAVPKAVAVWTAHVLSLYVLPLKHRYKKMAYIRNMSKKGSSIHS